MIREARPTDRPRLLALRDAALTEPSTGLLEYALESSSLDRLGPAGPFVLVACEPPADEPVGYALAVPDATEETATLAELAVAPDHRRRGHGRDLVAAVTDRLDDHDRLVLTARADDDRARAFYRSLGFTAGEERPGHYGDAAGVTFRRSL